MSSMVRKRVAAVLLTMSVAGFSGWMAQEGFSSSPYVPTRGDVPTIGYGSTRYENGAQVKMTDPPISRQRAELLARNLHKEEERRFLESIPGVELHQEEFDLYLDFTGQFGIGNWRKSSSRKYLLAGEYVLACKALLPWHWQGGRDCSLPENWGPKGCKGVWDRQQKRSRDCLSAQ